MDNIAHLIAPAIAAGSETAAALPATASYAKQLGAAVVGTVKSPQMAGTIVGGVLLYAAVSVAAGALLLGGTYVVKNGIPLVKRAYNATSATVSELLAGAQEANAETGGPVIDGKLAA